LEQSEADILSQYEALKKQKAKKDPTAKKKEETKPEPSDSKKTEDDDTKEKEPPKDHGAHDDASADEDAGATLNPTKPSHKRQPSMSEQSRLRSTSFRAGMGASSKESPTSPSLKSSTPLSPTAEAADIYRKQAQRIEELDRENKALQESAEKAEARWRALEVEVQELRESSSDAALLKSRADEAQKLKAEVAALQRQNTQLSQQVGAKRTRQESSSSPDAELKADLASKFATIDSLELDIASLNARISTLQTTTNDQAAHILDLESRLEKAQAAASSAAAELADLQANLQQPTGSTASTPPDPQLATLSASLSSARRAAADASARADKLDAKIATLTTLHRESESRHAAKLADAHRHQSELRDLRARLAALHTDNARLRDEAARRARYETAGDAAGLDELEDEERARLADRVRDLEAEVFDLRRGVWRDRRRDLQPGLADGADDDNEPGGGGTGGAGFHDVDLSASASASSPRTTTRNTSSFADVISSGISAFKGQDPRHHRDHARANSVVTAAAGRPRKQSLGLLDDDEFEFDEAAFARAQQEEAQARLERVREVKRGLKKWEGWRVDVADLRAGMGDVFEV
jgi:hypothetical protein